MAEEPDNLVSKMNTPIKLKFRHVYMVFGSLAVILLLFITSPDVGYIKDLTYGATIISMIIMLLTSILVITLLHVSHKALHNYDESELQKVAKKSTESSIGAGLLLISLSISMLSSAIIISAVVMSNF